MDETSPPATQAKSRHLVIAGPGRAGTTFLVQWLGASGLDVGEFGANAYHPQVRAGLERRLTTDAPLPYVVKDPWLYTYVDDVSPQMVDVLVIPIRRLADAASSRIRAQRAALSPLYEGRDVFASTPGGVVASLEQIDLERILAVGFYQLVHWATANDVRTVLMEYPKHVLNADTACDRLAEWLPDRARAAAAHRQLADPR